MSAAFKSESRLRLRQPEIVECWAWEYGDRTGFRWTDPAKVDDAAYRDVLATFEKVRAQVEKLGVMY